MKTQMAFIQERGDVGNAMVVAFIVTEKVDGTIKLMSKHDLGSNLVGKQVFNGYLSNGQRLSVHSVSRLRDLGSVDVDVTRFYSLNGLKHKGMAAHDLEKARGIAEHFPNCHIRFYSTFKELEC